MVAITQDLLACRLALWQLSGVGPSTFYELVKHFPNLSELFKLTSSELKSYDISDNLCQQILHPNWTKVEEDLAWRQQPGHNIISWDDADYPLLLKEIAAVPPILYVEGDLSLLKSPQIAVVGSRNPSHAGKENARQFVSELVAAGYCITSGLACGIDAVSHQAALEADGKTIAVLGTGIDIVYPQSNKKLAADIVNNGVLVSEFPRQTKPLAPHFPRRNRLISGLSTGVLVVEAAQRSGSLITARYAMEQNRDVFAIPGSIHNPLARGCHELIRNGAKLVEKTQDILEELGSLTSFVTKQVEVKNLALQLDKDHLKLVKCLEDRVVSVDVLLARSGLNPQTMAPLLLDLELKGVIICAPGGYMRA